MIPPTRYLRPLPLILLISASSSASGAFLSQRPSGTATMSPNPPRRQQRPCAVQAGYDRSTERADSFILPTLQKAFGPTVASYEMVGDRIIQPNAVGMRLRLPEDGRTTGEDGRPCVQRWPEEVFLKQVLATDYVGARKDWSDLRRTLLYARTELRFYRDVLPAMNERGFRATPKVFYAQYDFDGWIDEGERATQPADEGVDKDALPDPLEKGGWLVLECISDATHVQDSPLSADRARQCLGAAAELHASAWEDEGLLRRANGELGRAAFSLRMRNPKELAGIEDAWGSFCASFRADLEESGLWTDRVRDLGGRVKAVAERVSEEVTPSPNDRYATIIHGDYKAMNVMMGIEPSTPTIMIDMASASAGLGMSDVAMHIHHAVHPDDLEDGGEESLVEYYLQTLRDLGCEYPSDIALRHYKLCVIDYARFFIGRMWGTATPDTMAQKKDNKNIGLFNRSVPSAMRFVKVVDKYLSEIEGSINA